MSFGTYPDVNARYPMTSRCRPNRKRPACQTSLNALMARSAWACSCSGLNAARWLCVVEQAKHFDELADGHHEDHGEGNPEGGREHGEAFVHGAEDPVEGPSDEDVEGDDQVQADDAEPEQAARLGDVHGSLGWITWCEEPFHSNEVTECGQRGDEQERDSCGEAGVADGPVRVRLGVAVDCCCRSHGLLPLVRRPLVAAVQTVTGAG